MEIKTMKLNVETMKSFQRKLTILNKTVWGKRSHNDIWWWYKTRDM